MIIPLSAKVYWEIEEYICQNSNEYIGCSVAKVTMAHKFTSYKVNQMYNLETCGVDVLRTMQYMIEMGNLVECGWYGNLKTYTVSKEVRE